jgi:hypothetical protein
MDRQRRPLTVGQSLLLRPLISFKEMNGCILRQVVPANGAAMVHRQWVDDRGNPSSCSVVLWVGQPFGPGGPGGRDQV